MNRRPPEIETALTELPSDPAERHEALVDIFGRYMMWMREWAIETTRDLGESEESRSKIPQLRREKWERLSEMTEDERAVVYDISQATMDRFIQMFLVMMGNTGVDQRLGNDHSVRFKLDLEICDVESIEVVESETINRGGKKFFGDYWGRWLNRLRGN